LPGRCDSYGCERAKCFPASEEEIRSPNQGLTEKSDCGLAWIFLAQRSGNQKISALESGSESGSTWPNEKADADTDADRLWDSPRKALTVAHT
jgi:hypothetical protein